MKNKALYLRLFLGLLNEGTKDTEESISSSVKILPVSFDSSESNEKTSVFAETRTSTEIINNSGFSELNRMLARRNIIDEEAEKDRVIEKLVYELEEELNLFDEENEVLSEKMISPEIISQIIDDGNNYSVVQDKSKLLYGSIHAIVKDRNEGIYGASDSRRRGEYKVKY